MKKQKNPNWKCQNKTYMTWAAMKQRCLNPKNPGFKNYGGRGIKVCMSWLNSFDNFLKDMGEKPSDLTLERINNNGNYEPNNCRWATHKEQRRNTRKCKPLEINGQTRTIGEWSEITGISKPTLIHRLKLNLSPEELFEKGRRHNPSNDPKRFITFKNKTLSLADWANALKINKKSFRRTMYSYGFDQSKIEKYIQERLR